MKYSGIDVPGITLWKRFKSSLILLYECPSEKNYRCYFVPIISVNFSVQVTVVARSILSESSCQFVFFFEELGPLQMSGILICGLLRIISPCALLENLDKSVVLQRVASKTSHASDGK